MFQCGELKMFWFSELLIHFFRQIEWKKFKQVKFYEINQPILRFGQYFHASLSTVVNK